MTGLMTRFWHGVEHAMQVRSTRRQLEQLDDRMLQDLGISRAQARFEARRLVAVRHDSWEQNPEL